PAPTPIFMEEGLRDAAAGDQPLREVKAAEGISGKLNPAKVEIAKATHTAELAAVKQPPELPPPIQPPTNGPQPATPEFVPNGQPSPYGAIPGPMAFPGGVTLGQAIDEALNVG